MGDIEHWTIWLMPDSEWPFCVERGISERQIAGVERVEVVRADQLRGAVSALEEIAQADPVDMALDPTWAQRIARAELGIRPFDITGRQ